MSDERSIVDRERAAYIKGRLASYPYDTRDIAEAAARDARKLYPKYIHRPREVTDRHGWVWRCTEDAGHRFIERQVESAVAGVRTFSWARGAAALEGVLSAHLGDYLVALWADLIAAPTESVIECEPEDR